MRFPVLLAAIVVLAACSVDSQERKTAPEPVHRFLAVGDTGTGTADQRAVAAAMKTLVDTEGVEFIVLLGDNFYPTGVDSVDDPQWATKYEAIYGAWGLPVYAVLGNHDYGANGGGTEEGKGAIQVAYTLGSSTWTMPAAFYHFTGGPADFVVLDTNQLKMHAGDPWGQGKALGRWFEGAVGWKVVLGHHPFLSNGPHGNAGGWDGAAADPPSAANGGFFRSFFEETVAPNADLYLCGHDHSLQVLPWAGPGRGPLLVVAGAGGQTLTELKGANHAAFQAQTLGFAAVSYTSHELSVRLVGADGQVLYQTSLVR